MAFLHPLLKPYKPSADDPFDALKAAHLLNRAGVARLCYCGPVLHTRPRSIHASREPLQFGAEIYGHRGIEADLEVQDLALDCLRRAGVREATLDLGDARIVRALVTGSRPGAAQLDAIHAALAAKDATGLAAWSSDDFWRALHNGRSRDGRLLYPAFPYPNYTRLSRADADAMFAYLKTVTPVAQHNRPHQRRRKRREV